MAKVVTVVIGQPSSIATGVPIDDTGRERVIRATDGRPSTMPMKNSASEVGLGSPDVFVRPYMDIHGIKAV